ncbi:MAG: DUF2244 domain-containing protein [Hydrogenophilales bacterium]|jgi:uncharacterized membrane protein
MNFLQYSNDKKKITIKPNFLSSTSRNFFFFLLVFLVTTIAISFSIIGAWLIIPFSIVELCFIIFAFSWLKSHSTDFEEFVIKNDVISVRQKVGKVINKTNFNLHWVKLMTIEKSHKSRVYFSESGKMHHVALFIPEYMSNSFVKELNFWIGFNKSNFIGH